VKFTDRAVVALTKAAMSGAVFKRVPMIVAPLASGIEAASLRTIWQDSPENPPINAPSVSTIQPWRHGSPLA